MKKVFFIAAFLTVGIISQAQIKFGVKAGLNLANFTGDDGDEVGGSSKLGFHAGGLVNIPISSMFSVQPEVLYSNEGSKNDDIKLHLNLINIPVLLQYNNPSGFFAETGPQLGFVASAKITDGDESEDYKELFKSTNFSWALGAGYKLPVGVSIGLRYNLGLGNVVDVSSADVKTTNFQISVSYLFGGKK